MVRLYSRTDYPNQKEFEYINIGWGDKGFFLDTPQWSKLKVSTAINAAFLPSATAMHVTYSSKPIASRTCLAVYLSKKEYSKLTHFIQTTFQLIDNCPILIKGKGYSPADNFYEANGSYHMFQTCNSWTNSALKKANIPTSIYAFFPNGVTEEF